MKTYTYLLFIYCFLFTHSASSQSNFQHSYGIAFMNTHSQQQSFTFDPVDRTAYEVLTPKYFTNFMTLSYYPRLNIKQGINSGFSIGAPIAISAFAEVSASRTAFQEKKNYLLLSLPLITEWAWGYRAQRDLTEKKLGIFIQAGGALTLGRGTVGEFTNINPYTGAGLRFKINEKLGFEVSYGQNFISVLNVNTSEVDYGSIPPFKEDFGIAKLDAKDRRATKILQIGLSFR